MLLCPNRSPLLEFSRTSTSPSLLLPSPPIQIADTRLVGLTLPARLADFVRVQRVHRDEVADQLASDWTMKVRGGD